MALLFPSFKRAKEKGTRITNRAVTVGVVVIMGVTRLFRFPSLTGSHDYRRDRPFAYALPDMASSVSSIIMANASRK